MYALRDKSTGKVVTCYITIDDSCERATLECTLGTDSTDVIYAKVHRSDLEKVLSGPSTYCMGGYIDNPFMGDLNRKDLEIISLTAS